MSELEHLKARFDVPIEYNNACGRHYVVIPTALGEIFVIDNSNDEVGTYLISIRNQHQRVQTNGLATFLIQAIDSIGGKKLKI